MSTSLCSVCPKLRGPVTPTGPQPCSVLLVGDSPSKMDDRRGKPFVGPVGRELDYTYLLSAGITRPEVAVTNAMACSLGGYRNPTPEEARPCADHHMPTVLRDYKPDIVVLMGAVACSLVTPRVDLESQHGIPFVGAMYGWVGVVVPMYHPSAGIHDSRFMIQLLEDWPILRKVIAGLDSHPIKSSIPDSELDYRNTSSVQDLIADLQRAKHGVGYLAMDTETDCQGFELDPYNDPPFMLSYSVAPGHGRTIQISEPNLLRVLDRGIQELRLRVVLHNSLFDHPVLERMGVRLNWSQIHDTMEDAYLLAGKVPQGLKPLAYRLLGVRMSDYMDLVAPASRPHQVLYLYRLSKAKAIPQPYLAPRQWKLYRKAQSALDACLDNPSTDPQARVRNWANDEERDVLAAERELGRFPYRSIIHADQEQARYYACQDADMTGRLKPVLARELGNVRRSVSA